MSEGLMECCQFHADKLPVLLFKTTGLLLTRNVASGCCKGTIKLVASSFERISQCSAITTTGLSQIRPSAAAAAA